MPGVDAKRMREEERAFTYKHRQLMLDLHRTAFDPSPTYTLLLLLRQRFPSEVGGAVVRFLL